MDQAIGTARRRPPPGSVPAPASRSSRGCVAVAIHQPGATIGVHPPAWDAGRPPRTGHPVPTSARIDAAHPSLALSNATSASQHGNTSHGPAGARTREGRDPNPPSPGRDACAWPRPRPRPPRPPQQAGRQLALSAGTGTGGVGAPPRARAPGAFLRDWHPNNGRAGGGRTCHVPHRRGHHPGSPESGWLVAGIYALRTCPRPCRAGVFVRIWRGESRRAGGVV
jgi:hypothetical protein